MDSRRNRFYTKDSANTESSTRSNRNARLYKEVYGRYENSDNLPLEDNTNEIDMDKLKELVLSQKKINKKEDFAHLNIPEQRKRNIDEQKLYDINKILEKAKYENSKLKENKENISRVNKNILSTLQSTELSLQEIKEASKKYMESNREKEILKDNNNLEISKEENLSMTRELKYQNLIEPSTKIESTTDLSLDLFQDLKPTGNTIITKPITSETEKEVARPISPNFSSNDLKDIDVIKKENKEKDDFFTSSYEFSKNDFLFDDDLMGDTKKGGLFKIILLFLMVFIFAGVITYFIITYGIGIS